MQKSALFTVLSFLNTTKYPPSLLYLLMTLGPAMIFSVGGGRRNAGWLRPARMIGKVPMFYYVLHIPLIHLIAVSFVTRTTAHAHWMFESNNIAEFPTAKPPGWGYSLAMVYLVWAFVVIALYPLCKWFAALKQGADVGSVIYSFRAEAPDYSGFNAGTESRLHKFKSDPRLLRKSRNRFFGVQAFDVRADCAAAFPRCIRSRDRCDRRDR